MLTKNPTTKTNRSRVRISSAILCIAGLLFNGSLVKASEAGTTLLEAVNPRHLFLSQSINDPIKQMMPVRSAYPDEFIIDQADASHPVITPGDLAGPTKSEPIVLESKSVVPATTEAKTSLTEDLSQSKLNQTAMLSTPVLESSPVAAPTTEDVAPALQAEIRRQVQADIGDTIIGGTKKSTLNDSLALAIPTPTLFRTFEEPNTFIVDDAPIIIDNDEVVEVEATIKYKDMPTDGGKTRILTGAKFPVVVSSQINSKTAKAGDSFEARLKYDLKIGDRLIAKKGAQVNGHLNYVLRARSTMHSLLSPERWYRNSGCLGVSFDEVINDKGEHLPLVALPAQTARIVKNKGEGRVLGVNHYGQVVGPWSQQLRYKAIRLGLNAAMGPVGVFSFGAMPVCLGLIGAANPSFAFTKPVGLNVRHRRLKGFAWGFLSGIPGSWIIEDTVIKGQEAIIKPGDEFLVEFKEEFTGEPATDANLIAGAKTKVHGQVLPKATKKKKAPQA